MKQGIHTNYFVFGMILYLVVTILRFAKKKNNVITDLQKIDDAKVE